jgi:hypothetical protein
MRSSSLIRWRSCSLALALAAFTAAQSAHAQAPELLWSHDTKG